MIRMISMESLRSKFAMLLISMIIDGDEDSKDEAVTEKAGCCSERGN